MNWTIRTRDLKRLSLDTGLFRKMYLITLLFEMLAFLDMISLGIKCMVLSWGFFILVHNFFMESRAFKVKHKYLLWSFLTFMAITSVVHMTIWFIPNIVILYYTAVCFFMFYGMYTDTSHEDCEKEMVFLFRFFLYFGTVCAILSLLTLFLKSSVCFGGYYLGIYRNRLIGIYTNSNILAFSMIETIAACDILSDSYIRFRFKIKEKKRLLGLCAAVCCVCLFLSDSNASFLFLIVYSTVRVFCNMFFKNRSPYEFKFFKSCIIAVGFCVVLMSVSFVVRNKCQDLISIMVNDVYKAEEVTTQSASQNIDHADLEEINSPPAVEPEENLTQDEYVPDLKIGRQHYEVSSGRITLLKQGIEIFKHNPVLGVGRANLTMYGKKYIYGGLIYPDLHNGYLTILVCYGAVGLLIFGIFSFVAALDICKHLFVCAKYGYFGVFARLFSALVAYCGYCLFEKAILFDMTFMVGFFWIVLGYAMSYVNNIEKKNLTQK